MIIGQLVNGLVVGSMYALVAIGFTLVLGVLHRLNFAHSAVLMFGGFAGVMVADVGLGFPIALAFALLAGGILGLVIERISFRRLGSEESAITASLSSLAVGMLLTDLVHHRWGADPIPLAMASEFLRGGTTVFNVRFTPIHGIVIGVTLCLLILLHFAILHTRMGRNVRAVADDPQNSARLGVNVTLVTQQVFFVSSALASVAGLLFALRMGTANTDIGLAIGLKALAVMAIGGMGDLRGAVVGGLLVGIVEALGTSFGLGRLSELAVWVLMILVLVVRPKGLFATQLYSFTPRA